MEHGYLSSLGAEARFKALDDYLSHDVVAVVVTTSLDIFPELYTLVQKHDTPLYRTTWPTSEFMAALISSLSVSLAERITRHGVLVEVYGEGILMLGDSGIGKERNGHRAGQSADTASSRTTRLRSSACRPKRSSEARPS